MNCQDNQKLINLELDSLATGEQKKAIRLHVKECPACAREREELVSYARKMQGIFSSVDIPELSADFDLAFERRLAERPSVFGKIRALLPVRIWAPLAAAAVLAMMLLWVPRGEEKPVLIEREPVVIMTDQARAQEIVDGQVKEILTSFL